MKRFISLLLITLLTLGPVSSSFGQSLGQSGLGQQNNFPTVDSNRSGGTSFGSGSKEDKLNQKNPSNIFPGGQMFQEQATSLMYQVHILGEVMKPGTYRVPASTRVSEALERAGGILERGSERRIQLRRQQGGGRGIDLLSFKTFGNLNENPYLLDNDVIFVPLKQKVVEIEGAVKRPGFYELKNERTLADLIKLVGGVTPGVGTPRAGNAAPIKVVRFIGGQKQVIDVENEEQATRSFALESADVIVLPHVITEGKTFDYNLAKLPGDNDLFFPSYEERVFVLGAVAKPGPYPFSPYYDVRQYLTLAGGTTKLAKTKKIKVLTAAGKTLRAKVDTGINPGDTIVVPEKYMAPETFATLMIGITASVVGIASAIVTLRR